MTGLKRITLDKILRRCLQKPCNATIPRSGEAGKAVNCFVLSIDKAGEPYLVVIGYDGSTLTCLEWSGKKYEIERKINFNLGLLSRLKITHFYGLAEITFTGWVDYLLNRITCWPYITYLFSRIKENAFQRFYNKTKLVEKKRIDILRACIEEFLLRDDPFDSVDVMTRLYGVRWVTHPKGDAIHTELRKFLNALVHTGEIELKQGKYAVTGFAFSAVEKYDEDRRRHASNVRIQLAILIVTTILALLSAVQAGLLKFPVLLDFSN